VEIVNLTEIDKILDGKEPDTLVRVRAAVLYRITAALRDVNSRMPSGLGYVQWHGIIDVKSDDLATIADSHG
jgi:hypothetical protein